MDYQDYFREFVWENGELPSQELINEFIYSPFQPGAEPNKAVDATKKWLDFDKDHNHLSCRDNYDHIGIKLSQAMETVWWNVPTGTRLVVDSWSYDRWGRPRLNFTGILSHGFWWNERYIVENWVWLPDPTPEAEWLYLLHRVRCIARDISIRSPNDLMLEYKQQRLERAVREASEFASIHGFSANEVIKNRIAGEPVQLSLL